ncbi:dihydrolipoyl dehydrogenase family protein [Subtercola boreus]|uniref:Pyridine nucleotide-disulfide oxidoreductase n=1 Tax=Subtercola boreus TaxID=120213 RepID=A0A3E0WA07_9MICO|nr:NAD(P)/FAD-dependent oxidoreductase [Subtercola boreus]RFA20295.1 pyridine nucleotide-disulfide oxidoreductase [Subtercola boreus]RFA20447.1 pyridine nucleotide-disulfide oxidoreductase [Subtercola boreus]RFA26697.1 pyridine nucleotide-disulfide oxidoreductase [Subtercola boreus]
MTPTDSASTDSAGTDSGTETTGPGTGTTATTFDVIVIGAGAVGENVADRAAQGGLSTAIVEAELVGGECSYWACMPSKALLRSGSVLRQAQAVGGAREAVTGELDVQAVLNRRNTTVNDFKDDSQAEWVAGAGITLVRGHARFTGTKSLSVTDARGTVTHLTAKHAIVVSTGSAALLPDIPGLADSAPWTSREATSAQSIPARLAVLGGGVVGAEMATAYSSLGSTVTVLSRSELLGNQEPFAGELVHEALVGLGADVRVGVSATSVSRNGSGGEVTLTLDDGSTLVVDELLVAIGRVPNTGDLGLDTIGLEPNSWLDVDDTLLVVDADEKPLEGEWLYATGDVNHRALLTHQGKYQARAAGDVIVARALGKPLSTAPWGAHVATADHEAVPQVTFTDPEVASVGLTKAAAEKAGYTVKAVDYDMANVAGASVSSDTYKGMARMVVDEKRQVLLGATFVGPDVAELLHSATIAVVGEVPLNRLWHAVPSYPTVSEVWLRLLETYGRDASSH